MQGGAEPGALRKGVRDSALPCPGARPGGSFGAAAEGEGRGPRGPRGGSGRPRQFKCPGSDLEEDGETPADTELPLWAATVGGRGCPEPEGSDSWACGGVGSSP